MKVKSWQWGYEGRQVNSANGSKKMARVVAFQGSYIRHCVSCSYNISGMPAVRHVKNAVARQKHR